jgi:hypothetical protein
MRTSPNPSLEPPSDSQDGSTSYGPDSDEPGRDIDEGDFWSNLRGKYK